MPRSQQDTHSINLILDKVRDINPTSVLDIGCGAGKWGVELSALGYMCDGIEAWNSNILQYNLRSIYRTVYNADVKDFDFSNLNYDCVILGDVLEHLEFQEACTLIEKLKKFKNIFLILPISVCVQDGNALGNPYETHKYHWSDKEVRDILKFNLMNICVNDNGLVAIGSYYWKN
jgi:predicted TPR repeat methyltransferase